MLWRHVCFSVCRWVNLLLKAPCFDLDVLQLYGFEAVSLGHPAASFIKPHRRRPNSRGTPKKLKS